ncbi:hypothetical protein [Streptomyces sp. F001]|uniref:hypothetical protein n=1 Tax=Streptomyces sp. F001 TaxID=1510026 RepID=UPI001F0E9CE0|nr:hypothetical protein [Streptomyces sp. F001]
MNAGAGGRRDRVVAGGAPFGGSDSAGLADPGVQLGLTGVPFVNVKNGCATGGSALISAVNAIRSVWRTSSAVGFDKHPRGRLRPTARGLGPGQEYALTG